MIYRIYKSKNYEKAGKEKQDRLKYNDIYVYKFKSKKHEKKTANKQTQRTYIYRSVMDNICISSWGQWSGHDSIHFSITDF